MFRRFHRVITRPKGCRFSPAADCLRQWHRAPLAISGRCFSRREARTVWPRCHWALNRPSRDTVNRHECARHTLAGLTWAPLGLRRANGQRRRVAYCYKNQHQSPRLSPPTLEEKSHRARGDGRARASQTPLNRRANRCRLCAARARRFSHHRDGKHAVRRCFDLASIARFLALYRRFASCFGRFIGSFDALRPSKIAGFGCFSGVYSRPHNARAAAHALGSPKTPFYAARWDTGKTGKPARVKHEKTEKTVKKIEISCNFRETRKTRKTVTFWVLFV